MKVAPSHQDLPRHLFRHVDTLNELAVFLWLARQKETAFGVPDVARAVGVDEGVALGVLHRLVEAGLVAQRRAVPASFQYALAVAPPENLVERLCAEYRKT
jgi:hypothetical protein